MTTCHCLVSTWIAIVAILLNALVPTVSLAFEPTQNQQNKGHWMEVCSAQGTTWVQLGPDGQLLAQTTQRPADAPVATHKGHCLYCLTHAASFGLLPAPAMVLPVWPLVADLVPPCAPHVPSRWEWRVPAARAPPVNTSALFASTPYV